MEVNLKTSISSSTRDSFNRNTKPETRRISSFSLHCLTSYTEPASCYSVETHKTMDSVRCSLGRDGRDSRHKQSQNLFARLPKPYPTFPLPNTTNDNNIDPVTWCRLQLIPRPSISRPPTVTRE